VHEGNRIALAFSGPPIDFAWSDLATRAAFIEKTYDLPASGWLAALRKVIHEAMPEGMHEVMPDSPRCKL